MGGDGKGRLRIGDGSLNREQEREQNNSKEHTRSSCVLEMNSQLILYKNFCVNI